MLIHQISCWEDLLSQRLYSQCIEKCMCFTLCLPLIVHELISFWKTCFAVKISCSHFFLSYTFLNFLYLCFFMLFFIIHNSVVVLSTGDIPYKDCLIHVTDYEMWKNGNLWWEKNINRKTYQTSIRNCWWWGWFVLSYVWTFIILWYVYISYFLWIILP